MGCAWRLSAIVPLRQISRPASRAEGLFEKGPDLDTQTSTGPHTSSRAKVKLRKAAVGRPEHRLQGDTCRVRCVKPGIHF